MIQFLFDIQNLKIKFRYKMGRILQEHDDHAEEHEVLAPEDKQNLMTIKVVIIFLLLLAGLFVFFPYT
jgi:hypothetical protein